MHARQLVEIAGLLSLRSGPLLRSGAPLCSDTLSEYWIASRCRLDCWGRTLRTLGHSRTAPPADEAGDLLVRLVEEITLSETLTRIVAAICSAEDQRRRGEEAGPIGQNMLDGQREAASRLRALVFAWWPADSPRSRHARSLTKQAERWTDVLLAYVASSADVERFSHDPSRLREYLYDVQTHGADSSQAASQLLSLGLRESFTSARQPPLNDDLNRRIGGAAMALFGAAGFDGHGLPRSAWMLRAERTADDAAALVSRLFEDDSIPKGMRLPQRWRI